jgi:putative flavoprotein involved in K+ transport
VGTIIIGAGQAGLAVSRCLRDRGLPHVVLERGRIAQRWRSERWDSFTLLSPNWQTRLPGHRYAGPDPNGFMRGAAVVEMLEAYGRDAPVRTGVTVDAVQPSAYGWWVLASDGLYLGTNVVVATGDLDRPAVPALAAGLPDRIHQLHTSAYRSPAQLPAGGVLVVGAGPSGQQIADELARAGRDVHIAVGRH